MTSNTPVSGLRPGGLLNVRRPTREPESTSKIIHRWVLADVAESTITDREGGADGTNNGIVEASGNWVDDIAGDGDGSSHIDTTTLGSFGSNMTGSFAIAFSIQTTDTAIFFGNRGGNAMQIKAGSPFGNFTDAAIGFLISDDNGNIEQVYNTDTNVTDGGQYRVVAQKTGSNGAADMEIYVNQSAESMSTERSNGYSTASDFSYNVGLFGRNNNGSYDNEMNGILDDVCVYDDSLTTTEIQSYTNPF